MNELLNLYRSIPGKMLAFDLTGAYSPHCQICAWPKGKNRDAPERHLEFALLKKAVDDLLQYDVKFDCISLNVNGEPRLHPDFWTSLFHLFGSNERKCLFDTLSVNLNMIPMFPGYTDSLLREVSPCHGNLLLTCSMNMASAETGRNGEGSEFHGQIVENTRYLLRKAAERIDMQGRMKIELQCPVLEENEHEIAAFVACWSRELERLGLPYKVVPDVFDSCGITINIKREIDPNRQAECDSRFERVVGALGLNRREASPLDAGEGVRPDAIQQQPAACATIFDGFRQPRHPLWLTPTVRPDGEVSVCPSEADEYVQLGNLKDRSFLDIWLGVAANQFRIQHAKNEAAGAAGCSHGAYYDARQAEGWYWERFRAIADSDFSQASELDLKIRRFNQIPNKILTLDLTNLCNLSCYYCTFTQEDKHMAKPKKHMSLQEVKKVCNEFVLRGTFFETICLSVSGEPMFNPEFSQILRYLFEVNTPSKRLFRSISINTNATFLTEERTNLICDYLERGCGNMQLTLSINAASRETFIKTKRVDLFDRTIKNTRYLLKEKARRKIKYTLTTYLLFLVNEEVEHEAEVFRDFWVKELEALDLTYQIDYALPTREPVVIIYKRTYANEGLFKINQAGYDEMHRRVAQRLGLMPQKEEGDGQKNVPIFTPNPGKICGSPWLSPIIRHDGTLNFCLTDVDNHMPVGNVFRESFFDIWFSPEAESFRARLAQQKFGDYDLCKNCNYFDGVRIPENTAEEYRTRPVPEAAMSWQKPAPAPTSSSHCG